MYPLMPDVALKVSHQALGGNDRGVIASKAGAEAQKEDPVSPRARKRKRTSQAIGA